MSLASVLKIVAGGLLVAAVAAAQNPSISKTPTGSFSMATASPTSAFTPPLSNPRWSRVFPRSTSRSLIRAGVETASPGVVADPSTSVWNATFFLTQPTVVTIVLGMNDGSYRAPDAALFTAFKTGYEHILDSLKQTYPTPGSR